MLPTTLATISFRRKVGTIPHRLCHVTMTGLQHNWTLPPHHPPERNDVPIPSTPITGLGAPPIQGHNPNPNSTSIIPTTAAPTVSIGLPPLWNPNHSKHPWNGRPSPDEATPNHSNHPWNVNGRPNDRPSPDEATST